MADPSGGDPRQVWLPAVKLLDPLPSPAQQADSLILWIGDHQASQAQELEIPDSEVAAWVGSPITSNFQDEGLAWLLQQPQIKVLVKEHDAINGPTSAYVRWFATL
jgi:hypothetical protein